MEAHGSDARSRAGTIGWLLSCALHGSLVLGSLLFVQKIQLARQPEPFRWNVAMVSPERAMDHAPPVVLQPKPSIKPLATAMAHSSLTPRQTPPPEPPPSVPSTVETPPAPQTTVTATTPVAPPPPVTVPPPPPIHHVKALEPPPAPTPAPTVPQPALQTVAPPVVESPPVPPVHEQQLEPSPKQHVEPTQPMPAIEPLPLSSRIETLPPVTVPQATFDAPPPQSVPAPLASDPQRPPTLTALESPPSHTAESSGASVPVATELQVAALTPARVPAPAKPDYGWLSEVIVQRVEELKHYPADARLEQAQGKVVVKVVIRDDGSVTDAEIMKSSGFRSLDQAALDLMRQAGPFPLSRPLGKPSLAIRVPISYSMDRR